jgi:hypothetical protein
VKDFIATIGERGVMKTKVFGLALMLSLATMLGACDGGGEPSGTTTTPPATTGGEPADTGTTPPAETTPGATTPPAETTPGATTPPTEATPATP